MVSLGYFGQKKKEMKKASNATCMNRAKPSSLSNQTAFEHLNMSATRDKQKLRERHMSEFVCLFVVGVALIYSKHNKSFSLFSLNEVFFLDWTMSTIRRKAIQRNEKNGDW